MLIIKTEKYLLALKCLLAAAALDKEHPKVHEQTIRFKLAIDEDSETLPPQSAEIIASEFTLLPASAKLAELNDEYLSKHNDSAQSTFSALTIRKLLSPSSATDAVKGVTAVLALPSITFEEAKDGLELLKSWNSAEVASYRASAAKKWPEASVFASEDVALAIR